MNISVLSRFCICDKILFIMNNINLQPGQNGLPPVKVQSKDYSEQEKIEIAKAAKEYGVKLAAEVYGVKWQSVAAWIKKKQGNIKQKIIIQSPAGQEITVEEITKKIKTVGSVDVAYVRVDENAVYWVRGGEHGSVSLWS